MSSAGSAASDSASASASLPRQTDSPVGRSSGSRDPDDLVPSPPMQSQSPPEPPPPTNTIDTTTNNTNNMIEIEVDSNDADSAYNESWENSRRYHAYKDGSYWSVAVNCARRRDTANPTPRGPNDEQQQDAEDLMHELYKVILDGKLYEAPIPDFPQDAELVEFADEHPSAAVVGIDLSPIQPHFVPPNCRFKVDDVNEDWTFSDNFFDFVHVRAMTGCVPDWVEFHRKALRSLKPGGWIQQIEASAIARSEDGTIRPDSPMVTWVEVFKKMGEELGKTFFACEIACDAMKEAGFANVSERRIKMPIGMWPKDKHLKQIGAFNRQYLLQGLEGFVIRGLTELLGWDFEKAQDYLEEMQTELLDRKTGVSAAKS
ncbi:phosphoethanolamine n-methyltransferase 3 [Fusarium albosuccineum]|uniref:Phosphoethanolamine n-methyltransferase 3 n=1 Tax=Fusarium albosuccineum TaxID=1237068 RepID=A0A8H4LFG9_9HYPO|nr:phosphoethanolamine n-methyltransferase 3 [Fusarium albosuccineum]